MNVKPISTKKVTKSDDLCRFIDEYVSELSENSVLVITSKIIAILEGRVVKEGNVASKQDLVEKEADQFITPEHNQYGFYITVKNNILIASAGIDESNGNGYYIYWPEDPYASAEKIWSHLRKRFKIKNLGIIITDSKTTPLRWGVTGIGIAYCGFKPLNDFRGKPDLFGKPLHVTQVNVLDGLSAAAVLVMGEANEQTPLALIQDMPFVTFEDHRPTQKEIDTLHISLKEDIFSALLDSPLWKEGIK